MRQYIDLFEAKAIKKMPTLAPVDRDQLLVDTKKAALKLARHPFDIHWEKRWSDTLRETVVASHKAYNANREEGMEAFDPRWEIFEQASKVYRHAAVMLIEVGRDVKSEIRDYQERKSAAMATDAGYSSDFQFVESSPWLSAMEDQARLATAIDGVQFKSLHDVKTVVDQINKFLEAFANHYSDTDDKPALVEPMMHALANVLPFLLLIITVAK